MNDPASFVSNTTQNSSVGKNLLSHIDSLNPSDIPLSVTSGLGFGSLNLMDSYSSSSSSPNNSSFSHQSHQNNNNHHHHHHHHQTSSPSSSAPFEEITTIFVVGFPEDIQEREFQNMFIFSPGFEAATLKYPFLSSSGNGSMGGIHNINSITNGLTDDDGIPAYKKQIVCFILIFFM